jgi:hypothetical protein
MVPLVTPAAAEATRTWTSAGWLPTTDVGETTKGGPCDPIRKSNESKGVMRIGASEAQPVGVGGKVSSLGSSPKATPEPRTTTDSVTPEMEKLTDEIVVPVRRGRNRTMTVASPLPDRVAT